jgi:hypothetical protein
MLPFMMHWGRSPVHLISMSASNSALGVLSSNADSDSSSIRLRTNELWSEHASLSLPAGPSEGGEHSCSPLPPAGFQVRARNYLHDKIKIAAEPSLFDLMHVDMWRSPQKIGNVAARKDSWLRSARAAGDTREYLVILYVTPATPYIHLAFYLAVQPARLAARPHAQRLWTRFCQSGPEGDAFRNERWKVIPRIAEGPWAVQAAVGTKPALLGTKLEHTWILCPNDDKGSGGGAPTTAGEQLGSPSHARPRGSSFGMAHGPGPYIESDCDVSSSSMAYVLVSLIQNSAKCVFGQYRRFHICSPLYRVSPHALAPSLPTIDTL